MIPLIVKMVQIFIDYILYIMKIIKRIHIHGNYIQIIQFDNVKILRNKDETLTISKRFDTNL